MSNQLQITGGAKVRNLEGVLTGTSGVVSSLGINVPSGIPQLDGSGKILVSQLPNSVMEYKGTWDASTNTPTLADGTGNAGDVYVCNVAGTVNFGAGPITFYVGDQVLYSGTVWQRASGSSGSVTSVAVTETGDALTITGSPITTSGTINIGFAGTSTQYIAGNGTLVTFPSIISEAQNLVTEVYNSTGATISKGSVVYINGGQGNLPTITKAQANTEVASNQTIGLVRADITNMNNGYVTVAGRLENLDTQAYSAGTTLYLSPSVAGGYTSTKPTSPDHIVYVGVIVRSHPTQGVIEVKIQNTQELAESSDVLITSPANNDGLFYESSTSLWKNKTIANVLGYTPLGGSGTAGNVPYYTAANTLGSENGFMYDSSTNRFGVNTTVPNATIGANASIDSGYSLLLKNADANYNGLGFGLDSTYGNLITTQKIGTANARNFTLQNQSGYVSIDESGNLGVNILTPKGGVDIYSSTTAALYLHNSASGVAATDGVRLSLNSTNANLRNYESGTLSMTSEGDFSIITAATENFRVNSADGSIYQSKVANAMLKSVSGVITAAVAGTDYLDPSSLSGYVPTSRTISINGTTQDLSSNRSWSVGTVTGGGAAGRVAFWDGASNVVSDSLLNWDDTNNRLLVGTSTSVKTVTIYSSTADSQLIISGNAPSVNLTEALSGTILYQAKFGLATAANNYSTGSVAGDFVISSQTGSTIFAYNSTEAMRVDTSRNVGIGGIARSGYRLHVYDTAPMLGIESNTTGNVYLRMLQAGTVVSGAYYNTSDTSFRIFNNNGGLRFDTSSVNGALTIASTGAATFSSSVQTGGNIRTVMTGTTDVPSIYAENNVGSLAQVRVFGTSAGGTLFGVTRAGWSSIDTNNGLGLLFGTTDNAPIVIGTNNTERMRITSGGRVAIGRTSPGTALSVAGQSEAWQLALSTDTGAGAVIGSPSANVLAFGDWSGTERMRITSGGFTKISNNGTYNSSTGGFHEIYTNNSNSYIGVLTHAASTNPYGFWLNYSAASPNSTTNEFLYFTDSTNSKFIVWSNGSVVNRTGSYGTISDIKFKENIVDATPKLSDLLKLKVRNFNMIGDEIKHIGFIAQEFEEVFPKMVDTSTDKETGDEFKSIKTSVLVPMLVKAIQELKQELDELKAKIN